MACSQDPNDSSKAQAETIAQTYARLAEESLAAYEASPFSALSRDYFSRFSRDPEAQAGADELEVDSSWTLALSPEAGPLCRLMAGHLAEFLGQRMRVSLRVEEVSPGRIERKQRSVVLSERGGGDPDAPESFTLAASRERVMVQGRDPCGLRDGVVRLVNGMGLRQGPYVKVGERICRPRLSVRLGAVPWLGSYRDLVFMGYNAVFVQLASLFGLSKSEAIPELSTRRDPGLLEKMRQGSRQAAEYGLKPYCRLSTRQKFPKDDPVLLNHPEIRGALTFKADGEYSLCTEHPLVRRYLSESVEWIFRSVPGLAGAVIIVGGEDFYHCFTRPYDAAKGHTNCPRCEALGAETVVANMCNALAEAARKANPDAEIVAWPYSAEHVWSADRAQAQLIEKLGPGTAILTEIEKDEYVEKPEGVHKHVWDYSIDLIGPGERAKEQISACNARGIPVYLKSEPELGFEAARLPNVPCLDRWVDRAEALASCGATGAFVFPAFRECYGTSATEVNQWMWWTPRPQTEAMLGGLADRIAGRDAGPSLRTAWRLVSEAIPFSPILPPYYTGPTYLGPAHPMCADPNAEMPQVFYGQYLFRCEATDADGLLKQPTFLRSAIGNVGVFGRFYRGMEELLREAGRQIDEAEARVPQRCRTGFEAEASPIRWFYHTTRTEANFDESCLLRDRLLALASEDSRAPAETKEALTLYERWREILLDEQQNAREALPRAEADMRLDFYYGSDHTFPHLADMIRVKLHLIQQELDEFLPSVRRRIEAAGPEATADV